MYANKFRDNVIISCCLQLFKKVYLLVQIIRTDTVSVASTLKVGYLYETAFHKLPKETDEQLDQDYISEIVVDEFDRNTELWTNREVVLAAKVLGAINPKKHGIKFATDNQMRRVYDIIFEVFRCKINKQLCTFLVYDCFIFYVCMFSY